jgi:hypothetical protein
MVVIYFSEFLNSNSMINLASKYFKHSNYFLLVINKLDLNLILQISILSVPTYYKLFYLCLIFPLLSTFQVQLLIAIINILVYSISILILKVYNLSIYFGNEFHFKIKMYTKYAKTEFAILSFLELNEGTKTLGLQGTCSLL